MITLIPKVLNSLAIIDVALPRALIRYCLDVTLYGAARNSATSEALAAKIVCSAYELVVKLKPFTLSA